MVGSQDILASLPFADDPLMLLIIVVSVFTFLMADQIWNGGRLLSKFLRMNNADRLKVRENILFNNGGKPENVSEVHFMSDVMIRTPYGPHLSRRAAVYNDLHEHLWTGNDRQIRIPLEALTVGEPCLISPEPAEVDFDEERKDYLRRIAILEGEKNQAWGNALDFNKTIAISEGAVKKELGGTIMMRPNGSGGFSGVMPMGGEGGDG